MIDGSERDIFQLQFPRELTPVTPGVHRGDTRNEKKRKERTWRSLFSLEKRSKYIDEDTACAGNPLRKIGHIDQTGSYPATDGPYVCRALELVTFNWRTWWQLARKLISFKARRARGVALQYIGPRNPQIMNYYVEPGKQWRPAINITMPDNIFHVIQSYWSPQCSRAIQCGCKNEDM